jgi:hypothetical protein
MAMVPDFLRFVRTGDFSTGQVDGTPLGVFLSAAQSLGLTFDALLPESRFENQPSSSIQNCDEINQSFSQHDVMHAKLTRVGIEG